MITRAILVAVMFYFLVALCAQNIAPHLRAANFTQPTNITKIFQKELPTPRTNKHDRYFRSAPTQTPFPSPSNHRLSTSGASVSRAPMKVKRNEF